MHAFVLRGGWHYLEHDWSVQAGDYAFEPPGETHTLEVPDSVAETIMLFHVSGAYIYVDPDGHAVGVEDVFTKLAAARAHYDAAGGEPIDADRFDAESAMPAMRVAVGIGGWASGADWNWPQSRGSPWRASGSAGDTCWSAEAWGRTRSPPWPTWPRGPSGSRWARRSCRSARGSRR